MTELTMKEKELVSLGAALGSNCVPCVTYHIRMSKKTGWSDRQIAEAIRLADQVRSVPAKQVLKTAFAQLDGSADSETGESAPESCCDC